MSKYCSDCDNLNLKDKKGNGVYKCKKIKKYVPTSAPACKDFANCYSRNKYEKQELYDESSKPVSLATGIVIFILALLIYIYGKIMGY